MSRDRARLFQGRAQYDRDRDAQRRRRHLREARALEHEHQQAAEEYEARDSRSNRNSFGIGKWTCSSRTVTGSTSPPKRLMM